MTHTCTPTVTFVRQPSGPKLHMQAFCRLMGAGQTWLGELRIFATHTHTDWWAHSVRRTWSICCHRAKRVCASAWGGGICCMLWEMGVGIRHSCCMTFCLVVSTQVLEKTKKNYAMQMLLNPDYSLLCKLQGKYCTVCQGVYVYQEYTKYQKHLLLHKKIFFSRPHWFRKCLYSFVLSLCACMNVHMWKCMPPYQRNTLHYLHVWLTTSAIHNNPRSDVHVLCMFWCLCAWLARVRGG